MLRFVNGGRGDNQAVDPLSEKHPDRSLLPSDIFSGIREDDIEACGTCSFANAPYSLSEIRVLNVANDHTDRSRAPGRYAASQLISLIAQLLRCSENLFLHPQARRPVAA